MRNDSINILEPIWSCGDNLPTALVDILETTGNEDNGDDEETGEEGLPNLSVNRSVPELNNL